jgi:hypothetical protein
VLVNAMDERSAGMRMCREVYGSAPRLGITMRPVLSLESGFVTIMGVVCFAGKEKSAFARTFGRHMTERDLARISVPYRFEALKP